MEELHIFVKDQNTTDYKKILYGVFLNTNIPTEKALANTLEVIQTFEFTEYRVAYINTEIMNVGEYHPWPHGYDIVEVKCGTCFWCEGTWNHLSCLTPIKKIKLHPEPFTK